MSWGVLQTFGAPGFNHGLTVPDLRPAFHFTATSRAVAIAVLAGLQNRVCRMGQPPLPLCMKPRRAPCHLPPLGEGSSWLAGCGAVLALLRALLPPCLCWITPSGSLTARLLCSVTFLEHMVLNYSIYFSCVVL